MSRMKRQQTERMLNRMTNRESLMREVVRVKTGEVITNRRKLSSKYREVMRNEVFLK